MTGNASARAAYATMIAVAFVAVVAVVLAAIGLADRGDADRSTASSSPATVVMTGDGTATGVPDQLTFSVAVTDTESDVSAAMAAASAAMRRVQRSLTSHDVTSRDVATTGLSIDPSYDYSHNTERLVGYTVVQRAKVTVRALSHAGAVLSAAAAAGGNAVRINGIALAIGDRDALLAQARKDAIDDARAKAGQYAGAAGVRLGTVTSVKEVSSPVPIENSADSFSAQALAAPLAVPIKAGSQKLTVHVQVVWLLR